MWVNLPTLRSPQGSWLPSLMSAEVRWGRRPNCQNPAPWTDPPRRLHRAPRAWARGARSCWEAGPAAPPPPCRPRPAPFPTCGLCQKVWPRAFPRWLLHPPQPSDPKPTPQRMPSCPRALAQAAPRSLSTSDPALGSAPHTRAQPRRGAGGIPREPSAPRRMRLLLVASKTERRQEQRPAPVTRSQWPPRRQLPLRSLVSAVQVRKPLRAALPRPGVVQ